MHLQIDEHASAYGLFHLAFANLDTRLSRSVVELLRCENAKLAFDIVKGMTFNKRLQIIRKAVQKAVDSKLDILEVEELNQACKVAADVARWRNERIHGEVRFDENRAVVVDGQGKPLPIDYQTCVEKINEAIQAGTAMEVSVPHLVAYETDLNDLLDESF